MLLIFIYYFACAHMNAYSLSQYILANYLTEKNIDGGHKVSVNSEYLQKVHFQFQ